MNMNFSFDTTDNVVVFRLNNTNLDMEISAQLKAKILIFCQPDIEGLIFDLSQIEYVDSSGLGALLLAYRQVKEYNIPIILVGVKDIVKKLLELSRINDLFVYYDNIEDAIVHYKKTNEVKS